MSESPGGELAKRPPGTVDGGPVVGSTVVGSTVVGSTVAGGAVVEGTVDGAVDVVAEGSVGPAALLTRRDARVSRPRRHPQWLVNQLPVGMLGSDFFVRFVSIFQELAEVLVDEADQIEHIPDASVTPTPLLSYLGSWIDVQTVDPSLPDEVQRAILRSSAKALSRRGTRAGLSDYLSMLSGTDQVAVTDGGGVWPEGEAPDDAAWVTMEVPATGHLSEDEFVALIRDEIPAHVRAELYIDGRRVLNTVEEH